MGQETQNNATMTGDLRPLQQLLLLLPLVLLLLLLQLPQLLLQLLTHMLPALLQLLPYSLLLLLLRRAPASQKGDKKRKESEKTFGLAEKLPQLRQ